MSSDYSVHLGDDVADGGTIYTGVPQSPEGTAAAPSSPRVADDLPTEPESPTGPPAPVSSPLGGPKLNCDPSEGTLEDMVARMVATTLPKDAATYHYECNGAHLVVMHSASGTGYSAGRIAGQVMATRAALAAHLRTRGRVPDTGDVSQVAIVADDNGDNHCYFTVAIAPGDKSRDSVFAALAHAVEPQERPHM